MNDNPYAPPAAPISPGGSPPPRGEPQPWEVGEVIKSAWEIYKTHWAALTLGVFVTTLVGSLPSEIPLGFVQGGYVQENSREYWAIYAPCAIFGSIVGQYFATCMTRAALRVGRENNVQFGDFFSANGRFLSFLGMSFLRTLAVLLASCLLIVPGFVLLLGFFNAGFYVVDQNMGPVESLKASWESSEGQKGNLFLYALAEIGLVILGALCCCLGLVVVVPLCIVARALIYMRMSGTMPAPPAYAAPTAGYGGYGPSGYQGPPGY